MATMLDYINEEETTLNNLLKTYKSIPNSDFSELSSLLILATGSSYNACLAAKATMEKIANISIIIEEPYNFLHYGHLPETVDAVLAVSQSGKSSSTIEAIQHIRKKNNSRLLLALTSDINSPITLVVDQVIDLGTGIETVGFVTKGYMATVFQLILLSLTIGKSTGNTQDSTIEYYQQELKKVINKIPEIIKKSNTFFDNHETLFKVSQRFVAIGYGPNWGTAKEFETKFTETVRRPSQGFELEAYMHGPYLEANHEHILFFIETPSTNLKRSTKLRQYLKPYVGATFTITTTADKNETTLALNCDCDELVSQLALVIPFQILAYKIATTKGIDLNKRIFDDFDYELKSKIE